MGARAPVAIAPADGNVAIQRLCGDMPEILRTHIVACVEKVDEIVLMADSPAWAARLKLLLADAPVTTDTRRITVRVMPRDAVR
jgi:hypothetical protein